MFISRLDAFFAQLPPTVDGSSIYQQWHRSRNFSPSPPPSSMRALLNPPRPDQIDSSPLCRKRKDTEQERRLVGRPVEKEAAAATEDSLHQPAAAGARSHFPAESLPGHEHKGGDSRVDQPHRGPGQGEYSPGAKQKQVSCVIFFFFFPGG